MGEASQQGERNLKPAVMTSLAREVKTYFKHKIFFNKKISQKKICTLNNQLYLFVIRKEKETRSIFFKPPKKNAARQISHNVTDVNDVAGTHKTTLL